jgi:hypothetical protein
MIAGYFAMSAGAILFALGAVFVLARARLHNVRQVNVARRGHSATAFPNSPAQVAILGALLGMVGLMVIVSSGLVEASAFASRLR